MGNGALKLASLVGARVLEVAAAVVELAGVEVWLVTFEDELETDDVKVELDEPAAAVELAGANPAGPVAVAGLPGEVATPVALAETGTGTAVVGELEPDPPTGITGIDPTSVGEAVESVEIPAAVPSSETVQDAGKVVTVTVTVDSVSTRESL